LAPAGPRLVELGCGAGNHSRWFAERGFDVTGIDVSPTAIEWAAARGIPRARFLVGDLVAGIPGAYDAAIDGHLLHCIIGGDRARVLANVHRALAPGGVLFVATMCGPITNPKLRACFDPVTRCQVVDGVAYRFIGDADEILDEIRAAGFALEASTMRRRIDDDDQDHIWAIARALHSRAADLDEVEKDMGPDDPDRG